jgi:hypothetical protein
MRDECSQINRYVRLDPVFIKSSDLRSSKSIKTQNFKALKNPGKIYLYEDMLFVNELGQGLHVYDISKPTTPRFLTFYDIIGNYDMAIKDDLLYVDNVIDLLQIDISNITNPKLVKRFENYNKTYDNNDVNHIAYYVKSNVVTELDCSINTNFTRRGGELFFSADASRGQTVFASKANGSKSGVGGSTARFTLLGDRLYTVDNVNLRTFELPLLISKSSNQLGWGIETIFPFKDKLFIGSNTGMYIFDAKDLDNPRLLSTFSHARACDPVVADEDLAYVTLRSGTACNGFVNQLDLINIKSLTNPSLIKSFPMKNPRGLAVLEDILYVGEGDFGLKVLQIVDKKEAKEINFDKTLPTEDIILLSNQYALTVGTKGFNIVDISDPKQLKVVSNISKN